MKTTRHWDRPVALAVVCLAVQVALAASVPVGTQLRVRMIDSLTSGTAQVGDTFHATLDKPVVVNGQTVFLKGTEVVGEVIEARPSGQLNNPGELRLTVTAINVASASYNVRVRPLSVNGESHVRSNVTRIGGSAGGGALIGAGAGTAPGPAAAPAGKNEARIESEAVLLFTTAEPMSVPASAAHRPTSRFPPPE